MRFFSPASCDRVLVFAFDQASGGSDEALAECVVGRAASHVRQTWAAMLRQRVFSIVCGHHEAILPAACETGEALASGL